MGFIKAAAFTALVASTGLVSAQGFFYEPEEVAKCSVQQNHRYLGCFTVGAQPFSFNPQSPIPQPATPGSPQIGDPSRSYIHWDRGDLVNITVTPKYCTDACRAHGFKYSALYNEGCRCGTNLGGLVTPDATETACNGAPCPGDRRESCGTPTGARIFVDPSYNDYSLVTNRVLGYGKLGCFYHPNLPSGE
ncbi:hypothetical protein PG990_012385 [Apiospora arundinis]